MSECVSVKIINIGIADYKVCASPALLESTGLGSCVGIALVDPVTKIGGLAHIMLPCSAESRITTYPLKFADTAVRMMIEDMVKLGASKRRIVAKIAGGACMFELTVPNPAMNVGERNIAAVRKVLQEENIPLVAEDTGKNYGRSLALSLENGKLRIKSSHHGAKEI
ncbi:MAG: chemotaxis protein CheD [Elusimicrobia bacterium RIFOXYB2_FULL_48_7]|nr:MAG: chemotaxis protein CheD [Elusimicrobia bacterium RIFOXYB2_FULL_48_7]